MHTQTIVSTSAASYWRADASPGAWAEGMRFHVTPGVFFEASQAPLGLRGVVPVYTEMTPGKRVAGPWHHFRLTGTGLVAVLSRVRFVQIDASGMGV